MRGVDLAVTTGEVFGFLGPNGAGRSTTVEMLFPSGETKFLGGQGYGAFQLPSSLLLAASFGSAALYLVEEIEGGYVDKLRATAIPRMAIVLGRLWAELLKSVALTTVLVLAAMAFGVRIRSGIPSFVPGNLLTRPMEVAASFNPVTSSTTTTERAPRSTWPTCRRGAGR